MCGKKIDCIFNNNISKMNKLFVLIVLWIMSSLTISWENGTPVLKK